MMSGRRGEYERLGDNGSDLGDGTATPMPGRMIAVEQPPSYEAATKAASPETTVGTMPSPPQPPSSAVSGTVNGATTMAGSEGSSSGHKWTRYTDRTENKYRRGHDSNLLAGHKPDSVTCPTCQGQGKVPKEKERHLVALIPADDERLQPSRTKFYVAIAVVTSLLVAFLVIFFIYPRSFKLVTLHKPPDLYPTKLYINTTEQVVKFSVQNWWYLDNPNYYPIKLTNLGVQAYMNKQISETNNLTVVSVPMMSKMKVYATLDIKFENEYSYLVKFCNDDRPWVHTIFIRFQATAIVNIMGYDFTSIVETYQKTSCGRELTTIAPTTTTTLKAA